MEQSRANESRSAEHRKTNIGVVLTIVYALVYGGFVFLSIFYPSLMSLQTIFGMNLAITYGLGLIVIAIILAMIYNQMVRIPKGGKKPNNKLTSEHREGEK